MTQKQKMFVRRHRWSVASLMVIAGLIGGIVWTQSADAGGTGPDVTVHYINGTSHYGSADGYHSYAVGTTSCNIGNAPLWWCDENVSGNPPCTSDQHPVIAQNLYRLKDGRFQQIGMGWLKHGFLSLNTPDGSCGNCVNPPHGGDQLGVGCTDAYGSSLNGSRPLGLRSEVNPTRGTFDYPETQVSTSASYDQRVKVLETDLDPALNPGALYWVEGHYIAADDASIGNALNNASYRPVLVQGDYDLEFTGNTVRKVAAITAWQAEDPEVQLVNADLGTGSATERFHVARKVTGGSGGFHYEYAVHNMNSVTAARGLTVEFPSAANITNAGFSDVDHHSGEPYATTDWDINIDGASGTIGWSTDTHAVDEDANALRWGTMFSFWFDSNLGPDDMTHTLELFMPGGPTELDIALPAPILTFIFGDGFETGDTTNWGSSVP